MIDPIYFFYVAVFLWMLLSVFNVATLVHNKARPFDYLLHTISLSSAASMFYFIYGFYTDTVQVIYFLINALSQQ